MNKTIYSLLALSSLISVNADKVMMQKKDNKNVEIKTRENYDMGPGVVLSDSNAMTPDIKFSGGFSFNSYSFGQEVRKDKGGGSHFGIDSSNINCDVVGSTGKEWNNLEYSFLVSFTGDTKKDVKKGNSHVEISRLKLKGNWGTFMAGVHRGVTDFMAVGAFNFIGGTGGILGMYKNVVNETTGVVIRDDLMGVAKDYTKVSYVTPRLNGLQLGYSYTPDGKHSGSAKLDKSVEGVKDAGGKAISEFGMNYKNTFAHDVFVGLSATAVTGKARAQAKLSDASRKNIMSYALGALVEYNGFSVGGEYLDNGRSLEVRSLKDNDAGKVYTVGVGYKHGDHAYSVAYLNSTRNMMKDKSVKADVWSVTYDYRVVDGLKLYGEAVKFDYKSNLDASWLETNGETHDDANKKFVGKNSGHAVIVGMAISF